MGLCRIEMLQTNANDAYVCTTSLLELMADRISFDLRQLGVPELQEP